MPTLTPSRIPSRQHRSPSPVFIICLMCVVIAAIGVTAFTLSRCDSAFAAVPSSRSAAATDQMNMSFSGSRYTSTYHVFASGVDTSKSVGMLIYADGSGEYGLKNPTSSYALAGSHGLIAVAQRHNMIVVTPFSPNKDCDDGDGSCWYYGDSEGYAQWAKELVLSLQHTYAVDKSRMAMGGYSSGAQLATEWWVPSGAAQATMTDGVIVAISYGGRPQMSDSTSDAFKKTVHMSWNVGSDDPSYTGDGQYGVRAGYDYYTSKGFDTSLTVVDGVDHDRDGQFGAIMDREITAHVPPVGHSGTSSASPAPSSSSPTLTQPTSSAKAGSTPASGPPAKLTGNASTDSSPAPAQPPPSPNVTVTGLNPSPSVEVTSAQHPAWQFWRCR